MSFNPFIYDSSFRGSPILSYGKATSGTIWPKIFAVLAGFLVIFGLIFVIWLWFFSQIPIPRNTVVKIILPANKVLSVKGVPLEWKQVQQLNKPMPTLAGMINNEIDGKFESYAIRLSFIDALFSDRSIWQINTTASVSEIDYQTPYKIFGWPWQLINQQIWLSLDVKRIFSFRNALIEDLPDIISGNIIDNEWQTDFFILEDFDAVDFVQNNKNLNSFATIPSIQKSVLLNYFAYQGLYFDLNKDYSLLEWDLSKENTNLKLFYLNQRDFVMATTTYPDNLGTKIDYTLPDGEHVQRLYLINRATSTLVSLDADKITTTDLTTEDSTLNMKNINDVSDLTCSGKILARLDYNSLQNLCSWIDICFVKWQELLFVNRDGKLVVCGY